MVSRCRLRRNGQRHCYGAIWRRGASTAPAESGHQQGKQQQKKPDQGYIGIQSGHGFTVRRFSSRNGRQEMLTCELDEGATRFVG